MSTDVRVEGADTVARTLQAAGDELAEMAPPGVGALIESKSRAAAPYVTGALRGSIVATTTPARVTVGTDLEYAAVIHNGWAAHNIAANPFLIPVAEDLSSVWGPMYEAETARIMHDVKGA